MFLGNTINGEFLSMEKIRLLVSSVDDAVKNDIFNSLATDYLVMTTSLRIEDLDNHLTFFNPDVLLLDLEEDSNLKYREFGKIQKKLTDSKTLVMIMGDWDACDDFQENTNELAEKVYDKPTASLIISSDIEKYFSSHERVAKSAPAVAGASSSASGATASRTAEPLGEDGHFHVLVVDDDPLILKMIKEQLHDDYDVGTAINGPVALKFLSNRSTNLILLDYEMPRMSGPEFLDQLREDPNTANIPVVFMTGVNDREKIAQVLSKKPQGYLLKPIEKDRLIKTIKALIG